MVYFGSYCMVDMPEIWLNYGATDVVLDIKAENLEQRIDSGGEVLGGEAIAEGLGRLDLSKPLELVILHDSRAVRQAVSALYDMCEQKSRPFPRILAEKGVMEQVKAGLPEGSAIAEFAQDSPGTDLVFVADMEFDGLFGYETISTRLLKKFGSESMLAAYSKRRGNAPAPGQPAESMAEAAKFADGFEVRGIELVSNSQGIVGMEVGHPSKTASAAKILEGSSIRDVGGHRTVIASTGRGSSNATLGRSLSSLWNCAGAIKQGGLAILVAECKAGLGSEALQQFVEGRLAIPQLKNPSKYVPGMEDLLFLTEVQEGFQVGLVSVLPEFYAKKLGLLPLAGIKYSMDYILKTQGRRQKVAVVTDGARTLLR